MLAQIIRAMEEGFIECPADIGLTNTELCRLTSCFDCWQKAIEKYEEARQDGEKR